MVLIPAYNEADNLKILLKRIPSQIDGIKVGCLVVDDGSTDGSNALLKKNDFIKLIEIKSNSGKGYALRRGLKSASYNKIIIFDGDMEIQPSEISKLMVLNSKNRIRCVMGHRFESLKPVKSNLAKSNLRRNISLLKE